MKKTLCLFILILQLSCAHSIHMVQATAFDRSSTVDHPKEIEARSSQFVILSFVRQTDYVDEAYEILQSKCINGRIEGITSQFSTNLSFAELFVLVSLVVELYPVPLL